ncbi:hypothetical protein ANCDUO_02930 [Ancylostoma duodenale]|uniref:Fork-head domain-containing protein n=1 Tax=Ancylostoma duodenale TaxID=51022 RepID=A0A0C2GZ05_9BILA|nr:hypothetical protein ANCDUO_02930 [Ancylostoma duodenale]
MKKVQCEANECARMDFLNTNSTLQLPQSLSNDEELVTTAEAPRLENIERPSLSYKDLIIEAIESSPEKRLKLNEIYQIIGQEAGIQQQNMKLLGEAVTRNFLPLNGGFLRQKRC